MGGDARVEGKGEGRWERLPADLAGQCNELSGPNAMTEDPRRLWCVLGAQCLHSSWGSYKYRALWPMVEDSGLFLFRFIENPPKDFNPGNNSKNES